MLLISLAEWVFVFVIFGCACDFDCVLVCVCVNVFTASGSKRLVTVTLGDGTELGKVHAYANWKLSSLRIVLSTLEVPLGTPSDWWRVYQYTVVTPPRQQGQAPQVEFLHDDQNIDGKEAKSSYL